MNTRRRHGPDEGDARENPPTIGDCRRQGMVTFTVRCPPPCGRVSRLTFDALRLPDETIFLDIPKKRRLRCSECGRAAREVAPSWNEVVAHGNGKRQLDSWIVVIRMPGGVEGRSSPMWSREHAIGLARQLADGGDDVLRIEGPEGDISAEEAAADRTARRR